MMLVQSALLLAAIAQDDGPCDNEPQSSLPFCDPKLSIDTRVADLVSRIPDAAVPGLLGDNATAFAALGMRPYGWWSEGLHGVAISPAVRFQAPTPVATSFPQILNLAASFNRTLFHDIGHVIATEARAFHSVGHAGVTYWAPNINIFRDPRWGRGQETPGEDPFLTSEYAVEFVRGMQGPPSEPFLQVSACCKHFSAYSQEVPRHTLDAHVTPRDAADTYWPVFEACITRGHVSSIMCSYNAVNGVPSCADTHLLTDVVRKTWGFDGYIVSDCGAVYDVLWQHNYTNSTDDTCAATLMAGMDLNCGDFLQQYLPAAMPKVPRSAWTRALANLFRTQMRLGLFETHDRRPFAHITVADIDTRAHRELAADAAAQSIVLLKNEFKLLPLDPDAFSPTHRLAMLGPHVHATGVQLGSYAGIPPYIVSPAAGLDPFLPPNATDIATGCAVNGTDLDETAIALAATAGQVILFVGLDQSIEAEDIDRHTLALPGRQLDLIQRVAAVASAPVVLVLLTGGPVDLSPFKSNPTIGAILYAGYLGQSGGAAIAQVLVGDVNPAGRLPHTFYAASFVDQVPIDDMHMRPHAASPGRTHRFYTGVPVYPFGHGLSYSRFRYELRAMTSQLDGGVHVTVAVHNVDERIGDHVLLCFGMPPRRGTDGRPRQILVAFDRVAALVPGDAYVWHVALPYTSFALATETGAMEVAVGTWTLQIGDVEVDVEITSTTSWMSPFWSADQ
ncbi:Aste57867_25470 [Aphanomyces stellatus]|uniref:Aste57867_25470 protein n=1 Tax=Aphanomyces stellatus TaxID=120398 RepID=A0A485LU71_9STRA|nr:hypothetical protein As57867_025391 [Aphanomyces stellatus]VFU02093.1 Aste57867_25470 [Aphanomyces stellatus]